jgi:hypothetical protein
MPSATTTSRGKRAGTVLAALGCALLIAACGSSSPKTGRGSSARFSQFVQFADCMRSHGVPSFPDPSPGGGIHLEDSPGLNPSSPAFKAAQQSCQKFMPGGGPGNQHPSAQEIAAMRAVSVCMRAHGVSGFPDPTFTPPSDPSGYSLLQDRGGVILAVPSTIDPQSSTFQKAAAVCRFR